MRQYSEDADWIVQCSKLYLTAYHAESCSNARTWSMRTMSNLHCTYGIGCNNYTCPTPYFLFQAHNAIYNICVGEGGGHRRTDARPPGAHTPRRRPPVAGSALSQCGPVSVYVGDVFMSLGSMNYLIQCIRVLCTCYLIALTANLNTPAEVIFNSNYEWQPVTSYAAVSMIYFLVAPVNYPSPLFINSAVFKATKP